MRLRVARPAEAPRLAEIAGVTATALADLHVAVAEDTGGVAGIMGLSAGGRLDPVWLDGGDRGRAAATALHDAVEAEALRSGLAVLSARVGADLRPFLQHRGWCVVSEADGRFAMERAADGRDRGDVI